MPEGEGPGKLKEYSNHSVEHSPTRIHYEIRTGAKDVDSSGSATWKDYMEADRLAAAWSPPDGSPYARFIKSGTVKGIDSVSIQPRFSRGEDLSIQGISAMIKEGAFTKTTGVVLNSGGPHSIAMAIELAKHGYQPIIMLDASPHPQGVISAEQSLATMLYYSKSSWKIQTSPSITGQMRSSNNFKF